MGTLAPGPSGGPGALAPRRDARRQTGLTMSLVTAALMFAPSWGHAQGVSSHYLRTPDPQQHLAQQYDPPRLPPEIMVPERPLGGRQGAAPPLAAVPLDPLPPEPTPTAPEAAPRMPLESEPNPLIGWCNEGRTRRRRCAAMLDRRGCNDDAQAVLLLEQPANSRSRRSSVSARLAVSPARDRR